MPSKYKTIKGHAKRRFYERAGARLDDDLLCRIVARLPKDDDFYQKWLKGERKL